MKKITATIVGASGYVGGELLRLLLQHPNIEILQVTSEQYAGNFIKTVHPNLREFPLKFSPLIQLKDTDVLFSCLPHGGSMKQIEMFKKKANLVIDLSADFRLNNSSDYEIWYGFSHSNPSLLKEKVLGLPEIHSASLRNATLISVPGCMATASILAMYPLMKTKLLTEDTPVIIEAKMGSSGSGNTLSLASHHAERSGVIRSFKPTGHRHSAEIIQELTLNGKKPTVYFSATSVEAVRGILITAHVFLKPEISEQDIWSVYRKFSIEKPFIRIVKESKGIYRYPEPKILIGTNMCEIGFEKQKDSQRLVVIAAIDNLIKGAAGQAVQCLNLNKGWNEITGLPTIGLHPL